MSQDKIAFEKLALENEMDIESLNPDGSYANIETETAWLWFQDGLRIATTEANKRIAELEGIIEVNHALMQADDKEIASLQASYNTLREALEVIAKESHEDLWQGTTAKEAISATPAESLQSFENEVIEKCAKVCDEAHKNETIGHWQTAQAIRALKQEVK